MIKKEKVRLNLDITSQTQEVLTDLKEKTQVASVSDVVRRALALFKVVVENERNGGKLVFRKADGSEETLVLL